MKPDQVNRLYKQLTPKELANLTIDAITNHLPDSELELIQDSVETGLYRLPHHDYRKHITGYEHLSLAYGCHYWKMQALATVAGEVMNDNDLPEPPSDDLLKIYKIFCGKLASIEQALSEVCVKARFDIAAVKWLAEISDTAIKAFRPLPPNTELIQLEFYRALFHTLAMLEYPDSAASNEP